MKEKIQNSKKKKKSLKHKNCDCYRIVSFGIVYKELKIFRELLCILVVFCPELLLDLHHVNGLAHHLVVIRLIPKWHTQ